MKKVLKWIGIVLGSLVGLILLLAAVLYFLGFSRLNKTYNLPPDNVVIPTDADSLAHGEHLGKMLCTGCHGADLGGVEKWFADDALGRVDAPNLTSGEGGVVQEFATNEDWVRAIRHGVDPRGKPLFMPSVAGFSHMSNEDLGAVLAYLKTIPPVNRKTEERNFTVLSNIMVGAGMFGKLPVEAVSHDPSPAAPAAGVILEYGKYLVAIGDCKSCHGEQLAGGRHPDPSVSALVPNLTPGGELDAWSEQDFITAIRTGVTASGHEMNPKNMPWKDIAIATDDELKAMFLYLKSLPKLEQVAK